HSAESLAESLAALEAGQGTGKRQWAWLGAAAVAIGLLALVVTFGIWRPFTREAAPQKDAGDEGTRPPAAPPAGTPEAPPPAYPPREQQARIERAVDRAVAYLKGAGVGGNRVGAAALPGLVLLDAGVPPDDRVIQATARFVRQHAPSLSATYDLSLAVLFLDRLGNQ